MIAVFDYASLYPSSMICYNMSHDTYVKDEKYKNLKNVEYTEPIYISNEIKKINSDTG